MRRRRARGRRAVLARPCFRERSWPRPTCPTSPRWCRSSTSSRSSPGERIEQLASRRKVEFESIDFNRRYLATVPTDHDPIALRELFSPGFLDWAARIRNEVEFGITDRQLYFTWRLGELTAEEYGTALDHAAGLFSRLRNEMEESGVHTYQPGPWHAGLEPFPDAAA